MNDAAVTSSVDDMAGFPKPRLRRRRILERPRLIRALDRSRAQVRMLVAGAGYGKTTLAEQWAAQRPQVAWVRARRSSADVAVLARQFAAAAAEVVPGCDRRLCERLKATSDPARDLDVLVDLLSEDMVDWPTDAWLIVDDYHLLRESTTPKSSSKASCSGHECGYLSPPAIVRVGCLPATSSTEKYLRLDRAFSR